MKLNIDVIKNVITSKAGRSVLLAQKNSPTILFATGVVGVVVTVVLASRATLSIDDVLDEADKNLARCKDLHESGHPKYSDSKYQRDVALVYASTAGSIAKLYAPAFIIGVASIGSLTGSHIILTRRNVSLTAAYGAIQKGFAQYRSRVVDEMGEDKDREFRYGVETREILEETAKGEPKVKKVKRVGPEGASIYAKFFDEYSKSWQPRAEYNLMFLECQQTYANNLLHSRGHVFLNEVYDSLGIERTKAGQVVGWVLSPKGDNFIDFGIFDGDRRTARDFVNGREHSILLDFNVDGPIYGLI